MNKFLYIGLCINILLVNKGIGQSTIESLFSSSNVGYINRCSAVNSKGYFYSVTSEQNQIMLLETNNSNKISRVKRLTMQYSVLTRDCYIDANDNIYISGYLSGAYRIWVIKLDKDLNVVWSNFYGSTVLYYMGGMSVNSNEVINIVGIDQFPNQNSQVSFSMLINKDGQLIKYEKIGVVSTTYEALYSSTPIGKSGFILVGTGGVFDGTKYPLWVMRIDENGNRLWNKFWVQSETDFKRGIFASTVLTINDSEIVIFGRKGDDQNATNPSTKEINTILVKMDINGNILKFKEYKSLPTSFNYSFGGAYDGNYYYFAGSNGNIGNGSFIAKIDQNFEVVEARTIDKSGIFFTDVKSNNSRVYFSGGKRNLFGNLQYWFLNADKNLQPWCDWTSLSLQSFDYTPVSIDFDLTSSGGGSTEINPIQASLENCIDIKESLCINSNISSITQEIMISNNSFQTIVGLDSVYCNKDTVISLIGKGIPSGGKFYLNGIEITSFNPAVLSLNTVYDLKYFNGSPGICSDTAIHQFIIYSKPDFTVNAMSGCIGDKIKVSLTGNNTLGNFQWTWDGGRVVSGTGSGPYEIIYSSPGVKTIRVSSNTNFCGNFEASKTITISGITVSISKDTSIINGSFVDLSVNPLGGTRYKFVWSPSNSLSCGDCPNPRATPKRSTKYCVTVTDEINGCTATSCVNVRVSCCK